MEKHAFTHLLIQQLSVAPGSSPCRRREVSRTNEPGRGLRDPSRDHGRGWEEPGKESWGSAGEIRLPVPVCQQWEEGEALSPLRDPLPSTQQAAQHLAV